MTRRLSSRFLFAVGFVILIGTNIAVLSGVSSNRSGIPETQIFLTEREVPLSYRVFEEDSGLTLRLVWRILGRDREYDGYGRWRSPAWLNAEKLKELGFNIDHDIQSKNKVYRSGRFLAKNVFIVLENNGEAYRESVKRAKNILETKKDAVGLDPGNKDLLDKLERAEEQLRRERLTASRLFAIDAGLNPQKLREKYHDRTRFIITKGLVKIRYTHKAKKEDEVDIFGYIKSLNIKRIHVPLKQRKIFDTILNRDKLKRSEFRPPRYQVELAYGGRFEPWIMSVQLLDNIENIDNANNTSD